MISQLNKYNKKIRDFVKSVGAKKERPVRSLSLSVSFSVYFCLNWLSIPFSAFTAAETFCAVALTACSFSAAVVMLERSSLDRVVRPLRMLAELSLFTRFADPSTRPLVN